MSWVDQQQGALAEDPVRRVYYLSTTTPTTTFYITDQLPQQVPLRVSASALMVSASALNMGVLGTSVSRGLELRLYDAFSEERVWNSKNEEPYILLGYFFLNSNNSTGTVVAPFSFYPAPSVETRSMAATWRLVLYDPVTAAAVPSATTYINSLSVAVDVRRGGKIMYVN